ncbi:MAG TPA: two-component system response regulator, partial [Nitrospiraceae bacterium]|nr:two-component system response regulator [Nitrospiraceae bacterium]
MVDLRMPETDGLHVLREIKRTKPEISVIMMSAYGEVA